MNQRFFYNGLIILIAFLIGAIILIFSNRWEQSAVGGVMMIGAVLLIIQMIKNE